MSIMNAMLAGRRVRLRRVQHADRPTLIRFDRDAARYPSVDGYRHWAAHRANPTAAGDEPRLAIETRDGGVLVGSVCATRIAPGSDRFGYGVGIGPRHRRHGYAEDAIGVLLDFMFNQLGYRRCEVGIYGCNHASLALHRKLGFREDGRLRDPEYLCGQAKYLVLMGITADEFAERFAYSRLSYPGSPQGPGAPAGPALSTHLAGPGGSSGPVAG
ncbi:RimJ/RimL family protein N-acetyltransferase [Saccharopolyspora erythraea NRRL 2338]|uniref:Uncharacterized protein n=4 Tax=Saccharopolyspora erythraea TaxID=1836 RepID=A4FKD6_SACEN|nr:GNAT family protein [Saccharopolyspora erythraea]PFG98150.1 RimJ/RimL family protein N-acetyltransferase [Saccharopolyspora erythraea NRRL 2338]QRK88254.1 GNAT family N-acetyltransferase [Saccharopolyspora erythraea]CAM04511.1 hypothetical protein SACE_5272 [Saccharopolyspora erythraea NRRL 2338]